MNITSSTPPAGLSVDLLSNANSRKLEDLKKLYADAMVHEAHELNKTRKNIRVKSKSKNTRKQEQIVINKLPLQKNRQAIRSMKDIRVANLNQMITDEQKNTGLPEQSDQQNIRREILFLRDIVNRRREIPQINPSRSSSQLSTTEKNHSSKTPRKKTNRPNLLEGQSVRTSMFGWNKKMDEYEHYDSVVRDLLSEIRLKKSTEKRSSRPTISPSKYSEAAKQKLKNSEIAECNFKAMIKVQPKKDNMVFRMTQYMADNVYEKKITSYIMFLYKVNFSNSIYVDLSLRGAGRVNKVKIGTGNNCQLIKSLIKRRFWLDSTPGPSDQEISFIWTQGTQQACHQMQMNSKYSPTQAPESEKYQKFAKKLKKLKKAKKVLQFIENNEKILSQQDIKEAEENYHASHNGNYSIHPRANPQLITNHIPHNYVIGSKKVLFMLMHWYYEEVKKVDPFTILPKTYHIRSGEVNNLPFKKFLECEGDKPDRVWIVKPGENTNRGNGINVASFNEVSRLIRRRQVHKNGQQKTYIIQRYLKPFLYMGRKFDIRHYLLITSVNGLIKAYWYKQGYIRTSSEKYDLDDLSNQFVHLTNDAIQKKSEYYGKYEPGNKVTYGNFQRYLDQTHPNKKYSFQTQILEKMKAITKDIIRAGFSFLDPQRKNHNFQLFGMDFMIDAKFRPYLIEVNANPCLEASCPILQRIIPILAEHTFRLALDPLLPPPEHFPSNARYQLSDRILEKLKYQLIFDQKYEGQAMRSVIDDCEVKFHLDPKQGLQADEQLFDNDGEQIKDLELD